MCIGWDGGPGCKNSDRSPSSYIPRSILVLPASVVSSRFRTAVKYFPRSVQDAFRKRALRPAGARWLVDRFKSIPISNGRFVESAATIGREVAHSFERRELPGCGSRSSRNRLSRGRYALPVPGSRAEPKCRAGQRFPDAHGRFRIVCAGPSFSWSAFCMEFWSVDVFCLRHGLRRAKTWPATSPLPQSRNGSK